MLDIQIADYFNKYSSLPLIDVRSPGEFNKGHIPSAFNIPLFTNDERAHVGTVYKQKGQDKAIELGYEYVTPKLNWFVEAAKEVAPNNKVVVHCWRGGMRSHSFAEHLSKNGFDEVKVVSKGYKAFRNFVLDSFDVNADLKVIGGYTGSGKTYILSSLKDMGCQTIDLEDIANHKGSAFGAIGESDQPTVEQFENNLFEQWRKLDFNQAVFIEDESHSIGGVKLPMNLFKKIRSAVTYFIDVPKEKRALTLVDDYAGIDDVLLKEAIIRISKRLGGLAAKQSLEALEIKDYNKVAMLSLNYYDKAYMRGVLKRDENMVVYLNMLDTNPELNAKIVMQEVEKSTKLG